MVQKFIVFLTIFVLAEVHCEDENPITFYDLQTNQPLLPPITTVVPHSENMTFDSIDVVNFVRQFPFIGQPCEKV